MICQQCNKHIANVQITRIINGNKTEVFLCEECANTQGEFGDSLPFDISNILSGMAGNVFNIPAIQQIHVLKCKTCKMTYEQFLKSGKLGCANCYETFSEKLTPMLKRLQGNSTHTGKVPAYIGEKEKKSKQIEQFKVQLNKAIEAEEYEKAAELRDKIKSLEVKKAKRKENS